MNARRLEALSDSTFAVALTVLIFDVKVPFTGDDFTPRLAHDLWFREWPHYLSYIISFAVVAMIWLCHHTIFRLLVAIDHATLVINLVLLALVVFIPFPTQVVADYIEAGSRAQRYAGVFYGMILMVASLVLAALWHHLANRRALLEPWVPEESLRRLTWRYYLTPVLYLVATAVALANLYAGLSLFLVIACGYLLHTGTRASPRHPGHGRAQLTEDVPA